MDNWYRQTAIIQWNANGLHTKNADFRKHVAEFEFPILAISKARVPGNVRIANYCRVNPCHEGEDEDRVRGRTVKKENDDRVHHTGE